MKYLFLTLTFIFSITANATTFTFNTSSGALTGMGDLDINGILYNVDFEARQDIFSTYGGEEYFWQDPQSAMIAAQAINHELGLSGITSINNLLGMIYGVWHPLINVIAGAYDGNEWTAMDSLLDDDAANYNGLGAIAGTAWSVASVQAPAPVPIPAAAWFFGHALIGLAGIKRMRL